METWLVTLIAAVVGLVGVVAGTVLGALLTARNDQRRWLREHRLVAYADVVVECLQLTTAPEGDYAISDDFPLTVARINVIGSKTTQADLEVMTQKALNVAKLKSEKSDEDDIKTADGEWQVARTAFAKAARKDLGA